MHSISPPKDKMARSQRQSAFDSGGAGRNGHSGGRRSPREHLHGNVRKIDHSFQVSSLTGRSTLQETPHPLRLQEAIPTNRIETHRMSK
jgi:hypothetical protein